LTALVANVTPTIIGQ